MICSVSRPRRMTSPWHERFLAMLPAIQEQARFAFRRLDPEAREDAIQETIANALVAFVRLVQREKLDIAYPTALTRFAVAQIHDGRRVGNRLNVRDVLSPYAQQEKDIRVERLDRFDAKDNEWVEAVVEDHRTPIPEQVMFRCDFPIWLESLPRRNRRIALALAIGHTTGQVAKRFHVSPGRISQLRQEMQRSWQEFQGEMLAAGRTTDAIE